MDVAGQPLVLHTLPGRLRLHLPCWPAPDAPHLEARLRRLPGVTAAQANPLTGNVLIRYDPAATHPAALLAGLRRLPPVRPGRTRWASARRAHRLAHKLLESWRPGPARPGPLTGQAAAGGWGAACRLAAAAAGLGLLACRRLSRWRRFFRGIAPLALALDVLDFLQSLPAVRDLLAHFLGRRGAELLRGLTEAAALLLSGSPLRLAFAGAEAMLQLARAAQPVAL